MDINKADPVETWRCGTLTGWTHHQKRGENPCDACRAAKSEYDKRRLEATPLKIRGRLFARAQARALSRLRNEHLDEYRRYYEAAKKEVFAEYEEGLG